MTAKTVSTSQLRKNLATALDDLGKDDVLVVTRRGKSEKAIVDLDKLEDLLDAGDPALLKRIKQARAEYERGEVFSFEEVFGNI